jgi:hypothetical protein
VTRCFDRDAPDQASRIGDGCRRIVRRLTVSASRVGRILTSAVMGLLRLVAFRRPIVFAAASIAAFPFPPPTTVERTPQILPSGVLGIGEKPNLTLATADHAAGQIGPNAEQIVERGLIQLCKRNNPCVLMPILLR